MNTPVILKGHIDDHGTVVVDEKAPLPPCQVEVIVQPLEAPLHSAPSADTPAARQSRREKVHAFVERIRALPCPPPPADGLSAKDYKQVLYGPRNGEEHAR